MPQLIEYVNKEHINPKAWLHIDPIYWSEQTNNNEEEKENQYFSDSGNESIRTISDSYLLEAYKQHLTLWEANCAEHNHFPNKEDEFWFQNLPYKTQPFDFRDNIDSD